jgi:hypothetical protein
MSAWLVGLLLPLAEKAGISLLEYALKSLEAKYPGLTSIVTGVINWIEGQAASGNPAPVLQMQEHLEKLGAKVH